MFPYGNIGGFPGNNQRIIKYKKKFCLSNSQFNMLGRVTCPGTQHLCFGVTGHYTLGNTHECFLANLASPLRDGCRKAMQSVITDFRRHDMCMPFICGQETLTDLSKHVLCDRNLDETFCCHEVLR